ncbi:DNA polymerase eta [Amyelois transitella]|uniref:DNA polymerase eta n=1 Tax=Amyelois transitella TaxID=680683 RepID=UPI00067E367F|nr:DNA polymerase eta [Amyelois transitella]
MEQENRVVVLIDMDCFYCQVEEKLNLDLRGKPIAVVQYNPWKGGGIIAVNYVARAMGVSRHMRGDEAKEKCPEIQLPSVPCLRGKADISKYRDAGIEVAKVLQKFTALLERASIDEAYLDITRPVEERLKTLNTNLVNTDMLPNAYALGYDSLAEFIQDVHNCGADSIEFDYEHAKRLLVGAVIVSEIRAAVFEETGYTCSAGIAHNKILAKLVCGMNKPNKQTILPKHSINILYRTLSLKKVKHLGGKFGDTVCETLKISKMSELQNFTEKQLQTKFDEKNGTWLYNIARGVDLEPVQARFNAKSIGCCKQLRGKSALTDLDGLKKWLRDLGDEIEDRLEKDALENNRTPRQMVVSFTTQLPDGRDSGSSRSYNFAVDDELCGELFCSKALDLVMDSMEGVKLKDGEPNRKLKSTIKFLGISVGKFEDNSESKKIKKINDYFGAGASKDMTEKKNITSDKGDSKKTLADNSKSKKLCNGKDYIFQKFFHADTKPAKNELVIPKRNDDSTEAVKNESVLASTLDKQESFFAKFLNNGLKSKEDIDKSKIKPPTTPTCEVVNCGENSNDSDYSSSTINNEINKSIALFEEDPEGVARVSSMRELLKTSNAINEDTSDQLEEAREPHNADNNSRGKSLDNIRGNSNNCLETFECPDCKKILTIDMFETHSDYHLALRLREEERQQVRNEIKERKTVVKNEIGNSKRSVEKSEATSTKKPVEKLKHDTTSSIAGFLVKIDNTVPTETCAECGKKVSVEKFSEHMDFHEAQRLSRSLNMKSTPGHFTSNSVKRKKKSPASPRKKNKMPSCKSIDSFFKS